MIEMTHSIQSNSYLNNNSCFSLIRKFLFILLGLDALLCAVPAEAAPKKADFTVVIDAGHGGNDFGAIDNGAREKEINLGVAKKLESLIRKHRKDIKAVMTRTDDRFISLQERANIANRNKGDLFISIHTNSVDKSNPNRKKVCGSTVYALGLHKDDNNLKVARRENSVIELESNYEQKYSGFDPNKDESYIIFEMAQKRNLGQSLKFADMAEKELVKTAARKDRGVKQAGFWVLWATSMPSVLVELDFICNPDEAAFINSEEGQEKLAKALFNALEEYVSHNKPLDTQKNQKKNKGRRAENETVTENPAAEMLAAESVSTADGSGDGQVATLVSVKSAEKKHISGEKKEAPKSRREYSYADVAARNHSSASSGTSRRRRSASSKKASDSRNYETADIKLKSEDSFLATAEKPEKVETAQVPADDQKDKKGKKNKKKKSSKDKSKKDRDSKKIKESKDRKDNNKAKEGKDSGKKKDKGNSGRKTFVVKSSGNNMKPAEGTLAAAGVSGFSGKSPVSPDKMLFRIQIVTSDHEIPDGDDAFCGLAPVDMFRENGMYKYTYGASSDRHEIEALLMNVKSRIPEAIIIKH